MSGCLPFGKSRKAGSLRPVSCSGGRGRLQGQLDLVVDLLRIRSYSTSTGSGSLDES
jgi:hypothetical protein